MARNTRNDGPEMAVPRQSAHRGVRTTTVQAPGAEPAQHDLALPAPALPGLVGFVRVGTGITRAPRPYESFRVDVQVELPTSTEEAALDATMRRAWGIVDREIAARMEEAREAGILPRQGVR